MKKVLVISNFKAGRKAAIKYKKTVLKFLLKKGVEFKFTDICDSESFDISEFDTIITLGGDGTVNKALPYLINSDKRLGIIPCGTANLLAARLGIPTNIKKALSIIEKGKIKKIDTLKINDKPCILRFGLGYDSDIIVKTPQSLKNKFGYFSYFVAGMLFSLRLKRKRYTITYNNKSINIDASCIIAANAPNMYQNIVSIAKKSYLDDGLFDVFILSAFNPITFVYEFIKIILGIKMNSKKVIYFNTSDLQIKNNWTSCHIDGEKTSLKNDIAINIIPKAIKVYCK